MAGHCETFDHTADVGLSARADTLSELLAALAEGLADVICPRANAAAAASRTIEVAAEDVEALTVDFLWAVMDVIQADRQAVARVRVDESDENHVRATLGVEPLDPARHEIDTEVKAITYHQLEVRREAGGWTARVILDL